MDYTYIVLRETLKSTVNNRDIIIKPSHILGLITIVGFCLCHEG